MTQLKSHTMWADSARCTNSDRRELSNGAEPSEITVISNSPVIDSKADSFIGITNDIPGTPDERSLKS